MDYIIFILVCLMEIVVTKQTEIQLIADINEQENCEIRVLKMADKDGNEIGERFIVYHTIEYGKSNEDTVYIHLTRLLLFNSDTLKISRSVWDTSNEIKQIDKDKIIVQWATMNKERNHNIFTYKNW